MSSTVNHCDKGCCVVGSILYGENYEDIEDAEELEEEILIQHEAYTQIYQEEFGHINYALPSYCVSINHLECLKTISLEPNFMYHSDLAICAVESDNLECLKFIVEVLGDVQLEFVEVGPNCEKYVKTIKKE